MLEWETSISRVVSEGAEEGVIVRGHGLSELIGRISFAEMMFLMLRGDLPTPAKKSVNGTVVDRVQAVSLQASKEVQHFGTIARLFPSCKPSAATS